MPLTSECLSKHAILVSVTAWPLRFRELEYDHCATTHCQDVPAARIINVRAPPLLRFLAKLPGRGPATAVSNDPVLADRKGGALTERAVNGMVKRIARKAGGSSQYSRLRPDAFS